MTPKRKVEHETTWISAPETQKIIEQVNGRKIHPKYLHMLVKQGRLARMQLDGRTYLYSKQDAEKVHIIERKGAGRKPKQENASPNMPQTNVA